MHVIELVVVVILEEEEEEDKVLISLSFCVSVAQDYYFQIKFMFSCKLNNVTFIMFVTFPYSPLCY